MDESKFSEPQTPEPRVSTENAASQSAGVAVENSAAPAHPRPDGEAQAPPKPAEHIQTGASAGTQTHEDFTFDASRHERAFRQTLLQRWAPRVLGWSGAIVALMIVVAAVIWMRAERKIDGALEVLAINARAAGVSGSAQEGSPVPAGNAGAPATAAAQEEQQQPSTLPPLVMLPPEELHKKVAPAPVKPPAPAATAAAKRPVTVGQATVAPARVSPRKVDQVRTAQARVIQPKVPQPRVAPTKLAQPRVAPTKLAQPRVASTKLAPARVAPTKLAQARVAQPKGPQARLTQAKVAEARNAGVRTSLAKAPPKPVRKTSRSSDQAIARSAGVPAAFWQPPRAQEPALRCRSGDLARDCLLDKCRAGHESDAACRAVRKIGGDARGAR